MNIKEYIESGLLESYVLGFASSAEMADVEQAIAQYPELKAEVEALQATLEDVAMENAVEPPLALRAKVLGAIAELNAQENSKQTVAETEAKVVDFRPDIDDETPSRSIWGGSWLAAASVVLLLCSAISNFVLYNRWQNSENRLLTLESQNQIIAQELQVTKSNYVAMTDELGVLRHPATQRVLLKGVPESPESSATVYWNKEKKEVYLATTNLPDVPADKQYQLWAIVNGKPVDAGVFEMGSKMVRLKDIPSAQAFAISLEARGGSTTEAGPKGGIYVLGNV
ncbi:MAG: anti-sigma factor [Spirosomataceae bacterium]